MGRRNWTSVHLNESGGLVFDIRVEREKGHGETVGYDLFLLIRSMRIN
jgi:hypothetical protein